MCLFPFVYVCINGCSFDVTLFCWPECRRRLDVRFTFAIGAAHAHSDALCPVLLACSSRWGYVARSENADCLYTTGATASTFVSTNIGLHRTKLSLCRNGQDNCVQSRHDVGLPCVFVNAAHSTKCCASCKHFFIAFSV